MEKDEEAKPLTTINNISLKPRPCSKKWFSSCSISRNTVGLLILGAVNNLAFVMINSASQNLYSPTIRFYFFTNKEHISLVLMTGLVLF